MEAVRVLGVLIGDVRQDPAAATKYGHFFAALSEKTPLVEIYDATLQRSDRWQNALRTFHPNRRRWQERFYKNPWAFEQRSRRVSTWVRQNRSRVDVVLQLGVLFNAAGVRDKLSLPVVIYTDYTARLSARKPEAGRSPLARRQLECWLALEEESYRDAAHVCVRSELVRRSLMDEYGVAPSRVSVIGGGVNFRHLPAPKSNARESVTILFIGKEFRRKGGDLLVEAFQATRQKCSNVRLVMVSADPWSPESPPTGIEVVAPTWNRERIAALYREADLFVLPSRLETWGDVLLEAMAFGLPVVGVADDAMGEIVVDGVTGQLVPPGDTNALEAAVTRLCQDSALRQEWGANARRRVESQFQWFQVVDRLLPVLTRVRGAG